MALGSPDMRILIVDNFPTMRRVVKTLLRQNGYCNFVEADDGEQARTLLKIEPAVEFIMSVWNMPNMNGIELLRLVRSDPGIRHLPFLMIASEGEKGDMVEAVKSGASNYVVKPFTGQALAEKMARIFSEYSRKAS